MAHEIQGNVFVKADPNKEEVVIPDGITEMASKAFYCCRAKKFVVPESVRKAEKRSSGKPSVLKLCLAWNLTFDRGGNAR